MPVAVSFINMKGGVGKTTLAMQVALHCASQGYSVLAVDLDPQSNLSQALMGSDPYLQHIRKSRPTVVDIFEQYSPPTASNPSPRPVDLASVILKNAGKAWGRKNLDLIPSRLELSHTLKNPTSKERRLAKALARIGEGYDLIIIDCAPTESILTDAAYFSSRWVFVPVKPEFMATIGLPLLARSMEGFKEDNGDHALDIAGVIFNHSATYSSGPEGQRSIKDVKRIAQQNDWPVFENEIKYSASYAKAAREGSSLAGTSYSRGKVIGQFAAFMREFFASLGLPEKKT